VSDGYIVGLAAYLLSDGLPTGYISELCVRPECQKQGFGIYTINAVMHAMKNRGCRVAVLTSTAAGRALYLKTGWQMDPSQVYFKITHAPDHH
jgi:ribosomal protein S18 acetylase RimI-like enzyme